uniref:Testis expressed 36 n=1 Tax=Seriola dumerili TaxID=41447 RepID=A0A3B4UTQ5_SERDU
MVKGGKRYSSMSNDGRNCLLILSHSPVFSIKLPFSWVSSQESREYPFSDHDNKKSLKDNISVFTHVSMKRNPRHNEMFRSITSSHLERKPYFNSIMAGGNFTAYQTDFMVKRAVNVPTSTRRFPRNHKQKSAEAALAQAEEQFMWFGRHDSDLSETLKVLAATNCSNIPITRGVCSVQIRAPLLKRFCTAHVCV